MEIKELLSIVVTRKASDLHLVPGYYPVLRINGELHPLVTLPMLSSQACETLIFGIVSVEQKEMLLANRELDFSTSITDETRTHNYRFRVNAYYQKNVLSAAFRFIPYTIKTIEELNLPQILHQFTRIRQGFILFTGPTGEGKSTSLASLINEINLSRADHIITIEDPIEYIYPQAKSIISQRELRLDTHSWDVALRSVLREDPDVVLVGEMRDYETIAAALTIAETGHLVFSTLHTNSAAQTIDRIIDVFPPYQQTQVRMQLSMVLGGIVCQKLIPSTNGARMPACEVLLATSAVRATIRDAKTHMIDNIIQTSAESGMFSYESDLARLVTRGYVAEKTALEYALRPDELMRLLHKK